MKADSIIIGAGAAGLMAALELGKAGKSVLVLEARSRVGGRIMPLDQNAFGFPAQGGAEFVHGCAPITMGLAKQAGLSFVPEEGKTWSLRDGKLRVWDDFILDSEQLFAKMSELSEDMPLADFLGIYFPGEEKAVFRNSIAKVAENYDAADTRYLSTLALREEWFDRDEIPDGKIVEGYGALVEFMKSECDRHGVSFVFDTIVSEIYTFENEVKVLTEAGREFSASRVILTVPTSVYKDIRFEPDLAYKRDLASRIKFGNVIKVIFRFNADWWEKEFVSRFADLRFFLADDVFSTWWTQYPQQAPALVGWMAGPGTAEWEEKTDEDLLLEAVESLSRLLSKDRTELLAAIEESELVNWAQDQFACGAYSYRSVDDQGTRDVLGEPYCDRVYFAGEVFSKKSATVEGAFESGLRVANWILGK